MHYVKFIRSLIVLCYGKLKAFTFGRLLTLSQGFDGKCSYFLGLLEGV